MRACREPAAPKGLAAMTPALRGLLSLLLPALLALLGGCGVLRPAATPVNEAAGPATAPAVRLVVEAPAPLDALVAQHLDLARLQALPVGERLGALELARLMAGAPAQARELLQTEGFFDARVTVRREEAPEGIPLLRLAVEPGPRVLVGDLALQAVGPLSVQADQGDDAARALRDGLGQDLPLRPGRPFRNADWADTKAQVMNRLRSAGYAAPRLAATRADIDVPTQTARLAIEADSGPLFRAGALVISGLKHHDAATVRHLAGFGPGTPLTEARLVDYQERLRKAGLFQSTSVSFDPDPAHADAAPVRVQLGELPLQQATVGVGYSANTGPRTTLEHTHRRPFDWPVVAYNKLEWGRDSQGWTGDFQTHPQAGFYRHLLGVQIERVVGDTDVVLSQRLRLGRTQDTPRFERLVFAELLHSRKSELAVRSLRPSTASALTANLHLVWRELDSALLPTQGFALTLKTAAGQATSGDGANGPLAMLHGRLTSYHPLGQRWHGQLRLEAGQLFHREAVQVPEALGFRAGGDDSVRGYGYRALAPVDADGRTVGARKLFTASAEVARPLSERLPAVWGAAFIDAGAVADKVGDLSPRVGVGAGVRWRSPVGPLQADLAYGVRVHSLRLHMRLGFNF